MTSTTPDPLYESATPEDMISPLFQIDSRIDKEPLMSLTRPSARRNHGRGKEVPKMANTKKRTADEALTPTQYQGRKFRTVYADPPWDIAQTGSRGASRHYDLLTPDRIKAMPVSDLVEDDATLILWTTSAAWPMALEVLEAWGFRYVGQGIWDKRRTGLGNRLRISHEPWAVGVRGKAPWNFHGQRSVVDFPVQDHSHKPEEMIPLIERVVDGPYLELFARQRPNSLKDWSVWGNEIESDITIPGYPVPSDFARQDSAGTRPTANTEG